MVECRKENLQLSNTQLKKPKTAVKNKTGTTLFKLFEWNDLPHELLFTGRQRSKFRKTFKNNNSTYLKLSRAHIPKII